jgi:hypothetical protein
MVFIEAGNKPAKDWCTGIWYSYLYTVKINKVTIPALSWGSYKVSTMPTMIYYIFIRLYC